MKIALLLVREPFPAIFEETMARHFAAVLGGSFRVRWRKRSWLERLTRKPTREEWLCNPLINAIFAPDACAAAMDLPLRWYGRGPTVAKTVAQRGYVLAATANVSRGALAGAAISIEPAPEHASHLLIAGGNTRLRLFDFARGEATTILKSRFDAALIAADLAVRAAHPWLPAPPVLRVLDKGRAYVEPLLNAETAADITDPQRREQAVQLALDACERLGRETVQTVRAGAYLRQILVQCQSLAKQLAQRDHHIAARVGRWVSRVNAACNDAGLTIRIGRTHGDLALGNILVDGPQTYLIDWERTDIRICGFDAITLALAPRRNPHGLTQRARSLTTSDQHFGPATGMARAALWAGDSPARETMITLYLAEELLFHLKESSQGPITAQTLGLGLLLGEFERS